MATVEENEKSGEGDEDGLQGSRATVLLNVYLVAGDVDEFTSREDDLTNPIDPVAWRYPIGQRHKRFQFLTVSHWKQIRWRGGHTGERQWHVMVFYEGPVAGSGLVKDGWLVNYHTALETREMTRDLKGKWIGGHAYRLLQSGDPTSGPLVFTVNTIKGDKLVIREAGNVVDPRPHSSFEPMTSFSLTATVQDLSIPQVRNARNRVGLANTEDFVTGRPGEVLIGPMDIDQMPGRGADGATFLYTLTLNFLERRGGWPHLTVFDQFEFEGFLGSVTGEDGEPVSTEFDVKLVTSLDAYLGIFRQSLVSPPSGKRVTGARRP